jgi:hypothetical protein
MKITPIDCYNDLFYIENIVSNTLVEKIINTPWMSLAWDRQEGQSHMNRRRIPNSELEWIAEFDQAVVSHKDQIIQSCGIQDFWYLSTGFWVDEPGFDCKIHTDGTLPGAIQISWIGNIDLGTTFYHDEQGTQTRQRFISCPNQGYLMINLPANNGTRHLQWHGMTNAIPADTYRVTSYSWITPVK